MSVKNGKTGYLVSFVSILFVLFFATPAAAIPQQIGYQGYLTNAGGTPHQGTMAMTFRIYSAPSGGAALWSEVQDVPVDQGVYNVNLGAVTPLSLAFDIPYYLGITVGADGEMTPRQALTSVGYAFRAQSAENAGGWIYTGNTISLGTGTDNVGIGTTSPTEKLQVDGNLKMNGDIKTDRWLNLYSNTFLGVQVAGGGSLAQTPGTQEGEHNTAVGANSLYNITTGSGNTAVGNFALQSNTTGASNTALGDEVLFYNKTGSRNTAVGDQAGFNNIAGSDNVFLGRRAGIEESGSDRLYIANNTSTLIYGQFDNGRVCVNCTDPAAALDVNGAVRVRAQSAVWVSGNGVRAYLQSDSTVINMTNYGGASITRGATAGNKNVMLPITITAPFLGQDVRITGLDIYWSGETEFDAISAVLLRRQIGVCGSASCYANILFDSADHVCDAANNPTGCALHFDLTTNNVLTADSGILYLTLEFAFNGASTWIQIGGVKLTVTHN